MDFRKVISELHKELARIDEAIQTLERLQEGTPRRGRPPAWLSPEAEGARKPGRPRKRTPRQK